MRTRNNLISIRLKEGEAENLRAYANKCGFTQSALIRMLLQGKLPRPNPPSVFWEMLNELYSIHDSFRIIAESVTDAEVSKDARKQQKETADFILWLQAAVTQPTKVVFDYGGNENMGG